MKGVKVMYSVTCLTGILTAAKGLDHLRRKLKEIEELGGEGLILRAPHSHYAFKR